ncbi:MAG: type IVB secretion system protein IcmH/DotU [Gammaproteobacteria bacterium]|nr:type IVB secretion system protein IcmH/DotU [Gammaproteobacteria bacterium]
MPPAPRPPMSGAPPAYASSLSAPPVGPLGGGIPTFGGSNRLLEAGATLFALVGQLSNLIEVGDPSAFHARVQDEMQRFRAEIERLPLEGHTRDWASYALCTLVDASVLNSPVGFQRGGDELWTHSNMLRLFHSEAQGGQKFFGILEEAKRAPERNIELLEFLYVALSLGLKGQYALQAGGEDNLLAHRQQTYDLIRRVRGHLDPGLSPKWEGLPPLRNRIVEYIPLWVVASVAAFLLLSMFAGFWWALSERTVPVFEQLSRVEEKAVQLAPIEQPIVVAPAPVVAPIVRPAPPERADICTLLASDISGQKISVATAGDAVSIRIRGDGLFRSGRSDVNPEHKNLFARLARALDQVPGRIRIVGHTDNVGRNNWPLSRKRAQAVRDLMKPNVSNHQRIEVDGVADQQPLVPNNSKANRAKNRRVEIVLLEARCEGGA